MSDFTKTQKLLIILMEEIGELLEITLDSGVVDDFDEGCDLPAEFCEEAADIAAAIEVLDDLFGKRGQDQLENNPEWARQAGLHYTGIQDALLSLHKASSKLVRFGQGLNKRNGVPRQAIWDFWAAQVWERLHGVVNDAQYQKKFARFRGPESGYWAD